MTKPFFMWYTNLTGETLVPCHPRHYWVTKSTGRVIKEIHPCLQSHPARVQLYLLPMRHLMADQRHTTLPFPCRLCGTHLHQVLTSEWFLEYPGIHTN